MKKFLIYESGQYLHTGVARRDKKQLLLRTASLARLEMSAGVVINAFRNFLFVKRRQASKTFNTCF
jgi:hypothetical protein